MDWMTKDGKEIPITKMGETHLRNSIPYMQRAIMNLHETEQSMWSMYSVVSGEQAEFAIESELSHIKSVIVMSKKYLKKMQDELTRRNKVKTMLTPHELEILREVWKSYETKS